MRRGPLAFAFAATLVYHALLLASIDVWDALVSIPPLLYALIAMPALYLGALTARWGMVLVPLTTWVLTTAGYAVLTPEPGDSGREGVFLVAIIVYGPVIPVSFVLGKGVQRVAYTAMSRKALPKGD